MKKTRPASLRWLVAVVTFGLAAAATQMLANRVHSRGTVHRYQQARYVVSPSAYRFIANSSPTLCASKLHVVRKILVGGKRFSRLY